MREDDEIRRSWIFRSKDFNDEVEAQEDQLVHAALEGEGLYNTVDEDD